MIPARTQQNRNAFSLFWPTNDRVPGKKYIAKIFRFRDFWFKTRFETFWINSDQKNLDQNFLILSFFGKNDRNSKKNNQVKKFWLKNFFGFGIDSECFKTCFKPNISKSKNFFSCKFFFVGLSFFRPKWPI